MVYMLLGTGFEETEAIAPLDLLRRAGIEVKTVGLNGPIITGSHGISVVADMVIQELDISDCEMIVLPGGLGGVSLGVQAHSRERITRADTAVFSFIMIHVPFSIFCKPHYTHKILKV